MYIPFDPKCKFLDFLSHRARCPSGCPSGARIRRNFPLVVQIDGRLLHLDSLRVIGRPEQSIKRSREIIDSGHDSFTELKAGAMSGGGVGRSLSSLSASHLNWPMKKMLSTYRVFSFVWRDRIIETTHTQIVMCES